LFSRLNFCFDYYFAFVTLLKYAASTVLLMMYYYGNSSPPAGTSYMPWTHTAQYGT